MMRFYSESLGLTPGAFSLLRNLSHERIGLYYGEEKRELLADKLSPLVLEAGFDAFLDYYYLLKYDQTDTEQWNRVMDTLSVQETYFWREMDQVRTLVDILVPEYVKKHPGETIRIWSSACATGEEPLTIAMALEEANWFSRVKMEIHASDASGAALKKAKAGTYRERSFRNLSGELKHRYFSPNGADFDITPHLQERVTWRKANLMNHHELTLPATCPFIFCRNVFIYFSEQGIKKTVEAFYENMPSPGYLFVGSSESLLRLGTPFELEEIGGAFVYVKA